MRRSIPVACLLAATACVSESELRYTSTLQAETAGVALSDDGLDGYAAMSGTTCTIDASWGCPVADEDLPTEEERVEDHYLGLTLGRSAVGLHTIDHGVYRQSLDIPEAAVRSARLYDGGAVMVAGDLKRCTVHHLGVADVDVPVEVCGDGVALRVDRREGTLYASTSGGVYRIDATGAYRMRAAGDLVAWDASLGLLYTADAGGSELMALRSSGEEVWAVTSGGAITDLAARGQRGQVLVQVERSDGLGGLERRDGETGRLLGRSTLPDADGDLVVSDNGRTLAFVRPTEVNFFSLDTEGDAEPVIDETPPVCIDPTNRVTRD